MGKKVLWQVINISFGCNKNCDFCFVKGLSKIPQEVMGSKEIDSIVDTYKQHTIQYGVSNHNVFDIVGGEPLLYVDQAKELFVKIAEITPDIIFAISTNGLLLDESFILWTKKHKVSIALSANDTSTKVLKDIMRLISSLRRNGKLHIALTKFNLARVEELVDFCSEVGFNPRLRSEYKIGTDQEHLKMFDEIVPKLVQKIIDKDYDFYPQYFYEITNPFWKGEMNHICGRHIVTIDPNLNVRLCPGQDHKIGNLKDVDFDYFKAMDKSDHPRFGYKGIIQCEQCELRNICGSGCPLSKKLAFGRVDVPSPLCQIHKKVFPLVFKMGDRWIQKGGTTRF